MGTDSLEDYLSSNPPPPPPRPPCCPQLAAEFVVGHSDAVTATELGAKKLALLALQSPA